MKRLRARRRAPGLTQALDTTPPPQGGSVQVTFTLPVLPTITMPPTIAPLAKQWSPTDDLSKWRSVQTQFPAEYTQPNDGGLIHQGVIQCVVEYSLSGPNPSPPGSAQGSQQVSFPAQGDAVFYLDARDANPTQWSVTQIAPPGAPAPGHL